MDAVGSILDVANRLWDCAVNCTAPIRNLEENLESLRAAREELKGIYEDVKGKVQTAEQQRFKRTNEVSMWMESVEATEKEVDQILQQGEQEIQKRCMGTCCPRNCQSSNRLGKEAAKKLADVNELVARKGHFSAYVDKLPNVVQMDERPMEEPVGLDSLLERAWKYVQDNSVGIVGLYGMGGVGKTTLLKKINNRFSTSSHDFNVVIWVVISKEAKIEKIQEVIRKRLDIPDENWKNKNEEDRAAEIFRLLKFKKFALLWDDLWDRLDLPRVGVPTPGGQSGSKVVFTTRSKEVCGQMGARKNTIKVECLPPEVAMELFRSKVGEDCLNAHPDIPSLAEKVAQECKGLPLALITIGSAMACRRDPREWQHAIKKLKSYPSTFPGMGDRVFPCLKFSYDMLRDGTLKMCFLYCSIFPEDYNICTKELIELWIGEGLFDKTDDIYDARNEGEHVIGSLKLACLLERGESGNQNMDFVEPEEYVRMHDVIRDMALWISCENGEKENKILVQEHAGLLKTHGFAKWKEAERITLWGSSFEYLNETPVCPSLLTFLVRSTKLKTFPNGFFQSMHALRVLSLLDNSALTKLPVGMGGLVNLTYLNLSSTFVLELPAEFKNLKNLKILLLDNTNLLTLIPKELILSFSSLEVFSKLAYNCPQTLNENVLLEVLESIDRISDISITLSTLPSVQKWLSSPMLQRCIRQISFGFSPLTSVTISSSQMRTMEHLERININNCNSLKELKISVDDKAVLEGFGPECDSNWSNLTEHCFSSLLYVDVGWCSMSNLSWLIFTPSLQTLSVRNCSMMVEIIGNDYASTSREKVFSNLKLLVLDCLPTLKSICKPSLLFPCLKEIRVFSCPSLRSLPFDSNSAKNNLKAIVGDRSWWNGLHWEDEASGHVFSTKFKDRYQSQPAS